MENANGFMDEAESNQCPVTLGFFAVFLVAGAAMVAPDPAFALSCSVPIFEEAYERHDLLLHGKLVDKSAPLLFEKETVLVFETIKVYKGEHRDEFTVRADLSWDDYYREGEEYVLFADARYVNYYRDLCVGDYIATEGILRFLDDYAEVKTTGYHVSSLYDVASDLEMKDVASKMELYTNINRGNDFLNYLISERADHDYSCDLEADVRQAERLFADDVYVFNKLRQNSPDYTITANVTLSTNPQTGTVVVESQRHKAVVNVLNSPHFGNCFFVYEQRLIDKTTGELDVRRDSLELMCSADNAAALLPDLCRPGQAAGTATFATPSDPQMVLYLVATLATGGGIALTLAVYRTRKRAPGFR